MTTSGQDHSALLRDALREIRSLRERVARAESASTEPIAIVGMGCRFPGGANDPEGYWRLLRAGIDAVREVPGNRWDVQEYYDQDPEAPGKMYTRRGGFLDVDVAAFAPEFFNISPREAAMMDPQQRLLLEICWEALENAGQSPQQLAGSPTGVFLGMSTHDYSLIASRPDLSHIDSYSGTGNTASIAAGRISYLLGVHGPSFTLDTACSSSLVGIHLACRSLASRECDLALAGGVNLILSPEPTVYFCKLRALSADGRCKTFDASADGYVRGEGCGVVVLKRLSDAIAARDNVLAVVRGSAVNQDGRSNGLTAPNQAAQVALIREALARARVAPGRVGYVEAHGTGTSLGDPIEVGALASALSEGRTEPLLLGSAKTNLGHLEAAAGIAGLIKAVLVLQHREVPPHLHLEKVNPYVRLEEIPARVPREATPWASSEPRIAGVSSFGFSGTNAHIVLEEAPTREIKEVLPDRPLHLFTASARSSGALRALAARYSEHLSANPTLSVADVCFTANAGRSHFEHRLAIPVTSAEELRRGLAAFTAAPNSEGVLSGELPDAATAPELAVLFTGQGSQYAGMGRELYEKEPRFRKELEKCAEILREHLREPLLSVLYEDRCELLDETACTQPALFALEWSLWQLWRSWGVEARGVMGHSVGEYVAACAAGVFSLEDALKLVAARGRLMQALPREGAMAALGCSEEVALSALKSAADVSIAAVNGVREVVISGRRLAVQRVSEELAARGVAVKQLKVSHAFHSALMEPMLDEFEAIAESVSYSAPQLDLISNVTGARCGEEVTRASYWRRHVREAVRFRAGLETLRDEGYRTFLEVGPAPVLTGLGRREASDEEVWAWSLRRGGGDWMQLLGSLGKLYVSGVPVNWEGFDAGRERRRVTLPSYPFERRRFWFADAPAGTGARRGAFGAHALLGPRLPSDEASKTSFSAHVGCDQTPFLADHQVRGTAIFPTSGYLELALAGATEIFGSGSYVVENLLILRALSVRGQHDSGVRVSYSPSAPGNRADFEVLSGTAEPCAVGTVTKAAIEPASVGEPLEVLQRRMNREMSRAEFYQGLAANGLDYGEQFQGVEQVWLREGEALGRISLPEKLRNGLGAFELHPVILDSCFQLLGAAALELRATGTYVPVGLQRLTLHRRPSAELWGKARLRMPEAGVQGAPSESIEGDLELFDDSGAVVATAHGLSLRRASAAQLRRMQETLGITGQGPEHPLLGVALHGVAALPDSHHWEKRLVANEIPYSGKYADAGGVLLPVAALVETALAAAAYVEPERAFYVSSCDVRQALVVGAKETRRLQTSVAFSDGNATVRFHTRGDEEGAWVLHATAALRPAVVTRSQQVSPNTVSAS